MSHKLRASCAATVVMILVSGIAVANSEVVQTIPVFFDCSCERSTTIYLLQASEQDVQFRARIYTAAGISVAELTNVLPPHKYVPLEICPAFQGKPPAAIGGEGMAWGVVLVDILDDRDAANAIQFWVPHNAPRPSDKSIPAIAPGPQLAYPLTGWEHDGQSHIGAFYRATPGANDALIVGNISTEDITCKLQVFDWDGNELLNRDILIAPMTAVRNKLTDLIPLEPSSSHQGALTLTVDTLHVDAIWCALAHYFEDVYLDCEQLP